MARCEVKLPEEMYKAFEKMLEKTPEIIPKMLEESEKQVLAVAKTNLSRAVTNSSGRSTGELKGSLGLSPVDVDSKGKYNIKIGFAEPRRKQGKKYRQTNAMIANILEYGRKEKQAARPFMRPAKVATKEQVPVIMQSTWDAEINKLGVKTK